MSILILFPLNRLKYWKYQKLPLGSFYLNNFKLKAKKGTRTLNSNLGKVILYQLSYFRFYYFLIINKEFNNIKSSLLFFVFV